MRLFRLCRDTGSQGLQVLDCLIETDHVCVFGLKVKQALLVSRLGPVPHRLRDHHDPQAILQAVHRGARTQPLVVQPVTIRVSTRLLFNRLSRSVPKKHEAYFLKITGSPCRLSRLGTTSTSGVPARSVITPAIFFAQTPASLKSWSS